LLYLYFKAIKFASASEKEQLLHLFSIHPTENNDKIESVKSIFNATGASKATQQAIQDYTLKAFDTLQKIHIDNEKKDMLHSFGENLMGRKV
jgi:geranylgeranyl diphosphate synthase, type II